jgi:hypothetical protein
MIQYPGPFVLDVQVPYQEHVLPMIPVGKNGRRHDCHRVVCSTERSECGRWPVHIPADAQPTSGAKTVVVHDLGLSPSWMSTLGMRRMRWSRSPSRTWSARYPDIPRSPSSGRRGWGNRCCSRPSQLGCCTIHSRGRRSRFTPVPTSYVLSGWRTRRTIWRNFRQRWRKAAAFILDDLQQVAGKSHAQEELIHAIDAPFSFSRPPPAGYHVFLDLRRRFPDCKRDSSVECWVD